MQQRNYMSTLFIQMWPKQPIIVFNRKKLCRTRYENGQHIIIGKLCAVTNLELLEKTSRQMLKRRGRQLHACTDV